MTDDSNQNAVDLWNRAKTVYLMSLGSQEEKNQFERYFSMITSLKLEDGVLIFNTANSSAADLLESKYAARIKGCLALVGGDPNLKISFRQDEEKKAKIIVPSAPEVKKPSSQSFEPMEKARTFVSPMPLKDEYTFDEFVEGPSNSWAYSAAKGVVKHTGKSGYNPLFIHGGTGLGKTHLMQAIGNEIKKLKPSSAICYLTAETFLNEYVNHLQNGIINSFREKYRNIDVLLIDDIQFLQVGKNVQEEFFNTFNYLQGMEKQIVLTSDVAPKNLHALEERLVSRFQGGMVQEIDSPSYETRLAILKKKAEGCIPPIPQTALNFIADRIKGHVRAMEGALSKVKVILASNPSEDISPFMLEKLLKDFIEKEQSQRKLTIAEIQTAVAKKYNVTIKDILSEARPQSIVTPRQVAMYISRKFTQKSLPEIAPYFEKKHATILHGVKAIEKRLDVENDLRVTLEEILSEFGFKLSDAKNN